MTHILVSIKKTDNITYTQGFDNVDDAKAWIEKTVAVIEFEQEREKQHRDGDKGKQPQETK